MDNSMNYVMAKVARIKRPFGKINRTRTYFSNYNLFIGCILSIYKCTQTHTHKHTIHTHTHSLYMNELVLVRIEHRN